MEISIGRRNFLKTTIAGAVAASLDLKVFGEGVELREGEWSREKAIARLRSIENKSVSFLGKAISYRLFRIGQKRAAIYGITLDEDECIPTWTTGQEVYQNTALYVKIAEKSIYPNVEQFKELEKRATEVLEEKLESAERDKEGMEDFLKTASDIALCRAVAGAIEEYKDKSDKIERLARDLMELHEKHELPSMAIQQGKCPKELARYAVNDKIFDNAIRKGFVGSYNENYTQQKIAALIHHGTIRGTKLNAQDEAIGLAIDWIRGSKKTKKDSYYKAGSFVLEQIAEKTGGKNIFEGIANFLKLDNKEKREIFSNLGVELYGVVF